MSYKSSRNFIISSLTKTFQVKFIFNPIKARVTILTYAFTAIEAKTKLILT